MMRRALVACALFAASLAAFACVPSHAFLAWDDAGYVASNPRVQEGLTFANVRWALTTFQQTNWHPLTWLSYMLDCTLHGLDPRAHHWTNVWMHGLNAALVFLVLDAATGALGRSALVAALFALHPLHVESVAWVAERKDVLSTLFALLALAVYVRWTRAPSRGWYAALVAAFALALMAKSMVVTLPCVLLLLDVWPLGRWSRGAGARELVLEKLPLFVLSAVASVLTVAAQGAAGAIRGTHDVPLADRAANALVSYVGYLARTFWPMDLACFYPYPDAFPPGRVVAAGGLLAAVTVAAVAFRRRCPALLVGWLWYLGTLVPVIGLVQVGSQAMADRCTYVPLIGVFLALVWGAGDALTGCGATAPSTARAPERPAERGEARAPGTDRSPVSPLVWIGRLLAALLVAACFVLTRRQVDYWRDGMALFERALAVSGENDTIRYNLCVEASRLGRLDVAFANCRAAVRATVPRPGERPSLATVLERQGWRPARAAEQAGSLTAALGVAAWQAGRVGDATEYFAETVRLEPARADARNNLGLAYSTTGRAPEALAELGEALRLDPAYADARYNRGNVLANLGRFDEAVADYRAALTASPDLHEAGNNLGVVLERSGDVAGAERAYRATIERAPSYADPRTNLATLLVAQGRQAEAQALRASTPGAAELPQADAGPGGAPTREQE